MACSWHPVEAGSASVGAIVLCNSCNTRTSYACRECAADATESCPICGFNGRIFTAWWAFYLGMLIGAVAGAWPG